MSVLIFFVSFFEFLLNIRSLTKAMHISVHTFFMSMICLLFFLSPFPCRWILRRELKGVFFVIKATERHRLWRAIYVLCHWILLWPLNYSEIFICCCKTQSKQLLRPPLILHLLLLNKMKIFSFAFHFIIFCLLFNFIYYYFLQIKRNVMLYALVLFVLPGTINGETSFDQKIYLMRNVQEM